MATHSAKPDPPFPMNRPTENMALNRAKIQELPPTDRVVLEKLRENYTENAKVEIELHRSIFIIEQSSDEKYSKFYEQRKRILDQFRGRKHRNTNCLLREFWLRVLQGAGVEFHDPRDEQILKHLIDIRSRMYVQPNVRMVIEFEFERNPYFRNKILTKTYYIKCRADPEDAVIYDGIEITNMDGCQIEWLRRREENYRNGAEIEKLRSFFDYFNDRSENTYANRGILDEEIAFGFFLREKVIPKAIYFFTGELTAENDAEDEEIEEASDEIEDVENENDNENDNDKENEAGSSCQSSEAEEEKLTLKHYAEFDEDGDDEKETSEENGACPNCRENDVTNENNENDENEHFAAKYEIEHQPLLSEVPDHKDGDGLEDLNIIFF